MLSELDDFTGFEGGASTAYSSPGAPAVFDVPGGSNNIGTISPQDLLIQDPYMSAPNSTALTALTSPSLYESPDFGYDVSPGFGSTDFDNGSNQWFSLFPDQSTAPDAPAPKPSPAQESVEIEAVVATNSSSRRKSAGSPPSGRHSSVAGVSSRKRDKPLPPIVVEDPSDTVAMKRARNTLAARKSRERKAQRFEELEERIRKLEAERDHWKNLALSNSSG
ncbi:hypothetical protein SODALDRAFT_284404 [Sodiomyces alkalinus F11]|uniref:Cross-pathway control protein 1 n=1 Tax=Sodiomyces alkalinus (strain CBS 110278 / VKM F-3762 / F11) TaxID=1314773 RepID=A0A3N2PK65_SODAK|nr:hypothetical protein SODALDRAFT_284404 [Sodiomyces alkalinus F11]ROT34932.1 hypothetical protein SODALDRAFT_284404 [Sodiomyces alkalinus F11]